MGPRSSILAALVAGVIAALVLVGALVVLVPDPVPPTDAPPPVAASASPAPAVTPPPSEPPAPTARATSGPVVTGFHIGQPAPPLDVPQVGGGRISLQALAGKPVWVNFTGTYCPPCRDEYPVMNGFAVRYAETGLVVLAVHVREEEGTVASFAEALNVAFPIGLDLDGAAQDVWDAHFLPMHFFVDAKGIVRDGAIGGVGHDVFAEGLQRILPDVEVTP